MGLTANLARNFSILKINGSRSSVTCAPPLHGYHSAVQVCSQVSRGEKRPGQTGQGKDEDDAGTQGAGVERLGKRACAVARA